MADPAETLALMRAVLTEPKIVRGQTVWKKGNRVGKFVLAALAEGRRASAELHVGAVAALPDEDVSFQLCLPLPNHTFPIVRYDWRPPRSHVNKFGPHRGLSCRTGLHPFEENAELGLSVMVTHNLPVCLPVDPEPPDIEGAVALVCATFNLQFTDPFPLPPWSPTLL